MEDWSAIFDAKKDFPLRPFNFPVITQEDFLNIALAKAAELGSEVVHFGCGKENLPIPSIRVDIDKFVSADFYSLDDIPRDRTISVLYANNSIEHLALDEIKNVFNWCVKRKISMVFNSPNAWASYGVYANDYTHKTLLSFRSFAGLLRESGFSKIEIYRIHGGNHLKFRDRLADIIGIDYAQSIGILAEVKK